MPPLAVLERYAPGSSAAGTAGGGRAAAAAGPGGGDGPGLDRGYLEDLQAASACANQKIDNLLVTDCFINTPD